MSSLQRVSFKKGRTRLPRLSAPYVPGRRHERFWTKAENALLRRYYPKLGILCAVHLPPHHSSRSSIYLQAHKLGLSAPRKKGGGPKDVIVPPAGIDDILRREYELQDGKKRGAINAIADKLKLPRWWVTKRATKLGLVMPHKKEPPWTAAENALMRRVPLHDVEKCAEIFRQHGFARSPTAIMVHAKRINVSRRFREGFTGTAASAVIGFDNKTLTQMCVAGEIKATRLATDRRLPQQGGKRWVIKPADLRRYVLDHLERIDLRKVEKFAFVQLIANEKL